MVDASTYFLRSKCPEHRFFWSASGPAVLPLLSSLKSEAVGYPLMDQMAEVAKISNTPAATKGKRWDVSWLVACLPHSMYHAHVNHSAWLLLLGLRKRLYLCAQCKGLVVTPQRTGFCCDCAGCSGSPHHKAQWSSQNTPNCCAAKL